MSDLHYSTTLITSWSIPEYMKSRIHSDSGAEYKHVLKIAARPTSLLQPVMALMFVETQNKKPVALKTVKPYTLSPTSRVMSPVNQKSLAAAIL
jgi:hypothetical protein